MGVTIVVNMMTASHKGSGGTSMAFPDVCKTPTPGGPIPIPYPNIAMSSDTAKGSKKVKMDGQPVMLKGSNLKMSSGDEAGSAQGIVSSKIKGKAEFVNYSFDVKVEGKNVCRLADPTQQNMGSGNTLGPAHLQAPAPVKPGEDEACKATKQKEAATEKGPEDQFKKSGITPKHFDLIKQALNDLEDKYVLYFRASNLDCRKWITGEHQPKPHSVIAAKTIKPTMVEDVDHWLDEYWDDTDLIGRSGMATLYPLPGTGASLLGVVMSMKSNEYGMPMKGFGRDSRGKSYKGKWITGDYDLMDILKAGSECDRPGEKNGAFGRVKIALNASMGWDGIQHPAQSMWVPKPGETVEEFSVPDELSAWVKTGGDRPKKVIAKGRPAHPLIDDNLTVIAPDDCVIYLETADDYRDALICSGCKR